MALSTDLIDLFNGLYDDALSAEGDISSQLQFTFVNGIADALVTSLNTATLIPTPFIYSGTTTSGTSAGTVSLAGVFVNALLSKPTFVASLNSLLSGMYAGTKGLSDFGTEFSDALDVFTKGAFIPAAIQGIVVPPTAPYPPTVPFAGMATFTADTALCLPAFETGLQSLLTSMESGAVTNDAFGSSLASLILTYWNSTLILSNSSAPFVGLQANGVLSVLS